MLSATSPLQNALQRTPCCGMFDISYYYGYLLYASYLSILHDSTLKGRMKAPHLNLNGLESFTLVKQEWNEKVRHFCLLGSILGRSSVRWHLYTYVALIKSDKMHPHNFRPSSPGPPPSSRVRRIASWQVLTFASCFRAKSDDSIGYWRAPSPM